MRVKLPFVGPAYQARSTNVDCQRTVNCYLEMDNASPRAPVALYGTPGTVRRATLPSGGVRAVLIAGGYSWWLSGCELYRVDASFEVAHIGTINGSGAVGMASNGAEILLVDGIGGYLVNVASGMFAPITDDGFPVGVTRAAYQDGFFLVTGDGSGKFYINETPYDGSQWNGLDFASAEGSPDNTVGIISDHREVWLFGSDSAEVWVNTGNTDMPFQRSGNAFIEHGCVAASTIAKADNTIFWLGGDDKGSGIVWRADGYTPMRISTHALEHAIASCDDLSDATAWTYQQEGHIFYVLTFPTADKTWVFDAATQQWHERAWRDPADSSLHRWRPSCHAFFNGEHLVGDFENGNIYALDLDTYTDDGAPILRLRTTAASESLQQRMFYSRLQIDMETGVGLNDGQGIDPQLMLRYSNDGGHTWSTPKCASMGRIGEFGARTVFNRLGSGRNRVWEISCTDPVRFAILGAVVDGEPGSA